MNSIKDREAQPSPMAAGRPITLGGLWNTIDARMIQRSVLTALVVGVVLFGVNSGDVLVRTGPTLALGIKLVATMLIPFAVSLFSSALTRMEIRAGRSGESQSERPIPAGTVAGADEPSRSATNVGAR